MDSQTSWKLKSYIKGGKNFHTGARKIKKVKQVKVIEEVGTRSPSTAGTQELGPQFLCELTISTYRFKNKFLNTMWPHQIPLQPGSGSRAASAESTSASN